MAKRSLMRVVGDDYLRATIRMGRPGRVMPAFSKLSDAQVNAVVQHLRDLSKGPVPRHSNESVTGDAEHGAELYRQHCSNCHGDHGQGGKGTGVTFSRPRNLPIIPPALNNPGFQAAASDQMIKRILMKGLDNTPMPSFSKAGLKEQEINDIIVYIRTLTGKAATPEFERASAVLVAESPYSLEETLENVRAAVEGKNFRIIREQYLENGLLRGSGMQQHLVLKW